MRLRGLWSTHPKYGRQFEVREYTVQLPATVEGIRKYLGSGLIKGVGPVNAGRIVDYFGLTTLDVIETDVNRLREVPGIGQKRADRVARAWEEQKHIKEIMVFLQSHGVSTGLAVKIYKQYGDEAIRHRAQRPLPAGEGHLRHRLQDGGQDRAADGLRHGCAGTHPGRAALRAGHLQRRRALLRHPRSSSLPRPPNYSPCSREACETQLDTLMRMEEVIAEDAGSKIQDGKKQSEESYVLHPASCIFLPPFFYAEKGVANKLRQLLASSRDRLAAFQDVEWDKAFDWLASRNPIRLAEQQQAAVKMALTEKVSILTGGPGTGKTTITKSIIQLLQAKHRTVLLCAPTGRAAKRLSETTGLEAKTIHRLLEFKPAEGFRFLRDQENPLDADMVIVDETSMVDILLMNHLLKAVEAGSHLLLVGDVDQLPSVGAGERAARLDRQRRDPRHAARYDLPAGGGQLHHRQRAPHQPRRDAGLQRRRARLLPLR